MKLRVFILIVFLVVVLHSQTAYGCSCSPPLSKDDQAKIDAAPIDPEVTRYWLEEFKGAVLIGTVIKIEKKDVKWFDKIERMKKVTIRVEEAWLGVTSKTFVVYTNLGKNGDCGVPYVKGERYFFNAPVIGGQLWTDICSPANPDNYLTRMFRKMFGERRAEQPLEADSPVSGL